MGVLHGRDLLSSKFPTAIIKDASKRLHFVSIKHTIGDYFLTKLDNKWYFFKIDDEICEYRQTLTKSFKVLLYDTKHYSPIKSEIKEIELLLQKNNLPKIGINLANAFRLLSNRENTDEFSGHDINEIIKNIQNYEKSKISRIIPRDQNLFQNQITSLLNYLNNLDIKKIVTPVKSISNFIEGDLRGINPGFLGTIADQLESIEFESKKVNNVPLGSKKAWLLPIAILFIVALIIGIIYISYEQGAFNGISSITNPFNNIGNAFSMQGSSTVTTNDIMTQYPTPESAKADIDSGKVKLSDFPPDIQELISSIKTPQVSP